ncbi:hypothetical protein PR048_027287 [Dryococelus australis]|uniref:Transcriptional adapter n=1 Tax=Dryococelus australis TaxID=614101 RepID=A0ABQ9GF09_9NEOP|nr:hypothetical protein PR048_027287 [Dryococelus australis]
MTNMTPTDLIDEDAADLQFPKDELGLIAGTAGSLPDFPEWESCQTMPLVGTFPLDLPFPLPFHSGATTYSLHFTFIGSQDLDVKSSLNPSAINCAFTACCHSYLQMEETGVASSEMCFTCRVTLREPYIRCVECKEGINICLPCFSCGAECPPHENYHSYSVVRNEFPLFGNSSWKAYEEVRLLDAVLDSGFGNWSEVARQVQGHTRKGCEEHFLSTYVNNPELNTFSTIPVDRSWSERRSAKVAEPVHRPFSAKWYCQSLAGYNPLRCDFDMEYDNYAEIAVADIDLSVFDRDDKDYELCRSLQVALVDGYNNRQRERQRRKEVVREHGLILTRKTITWLQRYEYTISKKATDRIVLFMQLMCGQDFDYIMEGLHYAGELRQYILRLQKLRENGLTRFHSCRLYHKLKRLRDAQRKERRVYMSNPALCWRSLRDATVTTFHDGTVEKLTPMGVLRRSAPPLEIMGLPGYESLTSSERELCSNVRLVPESYLDFKRILVTECKRQNGLKLAQARVLIKIDVNKTRKLYDFLQQEGYISLPST